MDTLLQIGLSNAVVATLLALVVGCVGLVWRRPALLHSLWLLVLLKLLTPPLLWVPVPWPAKPLPGTATSAPVLETPPASDPTSTWMSEPDGAGLAVMPDPGPDAFQPVDTEEPPALIGLPVAPPEQPAPATTGPAPAPPAPDWSAWWETVVLGTWLTGSGLWFLCAIRRLLCFQRLLRHARLAPVQLQKQTERLARKLGMTRAPTVYFVPGRLSPMLWAFFGPPRLVLPADLLDQIDGEQRATLILHELAHLRRRDHWVRALEFVAMGLFWWHPVVWYVRRELREAEELCCDAWVVASLPQANRTYATALVETIDFLSAVRSPVPLLASGVGPVSDLKRRLTMIMRGTTPRTLSWRGLLLVCGLGAFLLPLLPAFAQAEEDKPPPADKTIAVQGRFIDVLEAVGDGRAGEKSSADAARLEAQLQVKQKEILDLEAKIRSLRDKLRQTEGAGAKTAERLNTYYRLLVDSHKGGEPQEIILRKVGDKWEVVDPKTKPAQTMPAFRFRLTDDDATLYRFHVPATPAVATPAGVARDAKPRPSPAAAPPMPPVRIDADRRLDELEKKLEKVLDQIEQMRKQLKTAPRQPLLDRGFFPDQDGPIVPPGIDRGFDPAGGGVRDLPLRRGGVAPAPPVGTKPPQL